MRIVNLQLDSYRNYDKINLTLNKGVNIFRGSNASGKTNLLEAISLFVLGGSFRAQDLFLIKYEEPAAHVSLKIKSDQENKLKVSLGTTDKGLKKVWKKNDMGSQFSYLRKDLLGVLFLPTDTEFVTGSPQIRRQFFNRVLSQIDRDYAQTLFQYNKTLRQRIFSLKRVRQKYSFENELDTWDETLVKYAVPLYQAREALVKKLNRYLSEIYSDVIRGKAELKIDYKASPDGILLEDDLGLRLSDQLIASRERDLSRVRTHNGPHRDDWQFMLNGNPLSETGSRGEQRSAIIAMRVAEARVIEEVSKHRPVLLLDDVLSELDQQRRETLLEIVKEYQTIITTTDVDFLANHLDILSDVKLFEVSQGKVKSIKLDDAKALYFSN
ncbi:DNA replication/repair protein RecF [Patescibacteria group bacterium]